MTKLEAYRILSKMWVEATEEQREALTIAQDTIESVDLTETTNREKYICGATNLPCIECNCGGCCNSRKEITNG